MRELEERDEIFPRSPAYGAVPNDGSSLSTKAARSLISFSEKNFPASIGGSGQTVPE
jgi:hypothetical protein